MRTHYYSGWYDGNLPEPFAASLREDITDKSSLAIIWGAWGIDEYANIAINDWLNPANIIFEEYHAVDTRMDKSEAQDAVKNASVILLTGGDTIPQMDFITDYGLDKAIKESRANVIIGISAGSHNMAKKYVDAANNNYESGERAVYDGLGLDDFAFVPYFSLGETVRHGLESTKLIQNYLLPLSKEINIYAACDGASIRVKDGLVNVITGDVYLISGSAINNYRGNNDSADN